MSAPSRPAVLCVLIACAAHGGCYLSHERARDAATPRDSEVRDAGAVVFEPVAVDGGGRDAELVDAPPDATALREDAGLVTDPVPGETDACVVTPPPDVACASFRLRGEPRVLEWSVPYGRNVIHRRGGGWVWVSGASPFVFPTARYTIVLVTEHVDAVRVVPVDAISLDDHLFLGSWAAFDPCREEWLVQQAPAGRGSMRLVRVGIDGHLRGEPIVASPELHGAEVFDGTRFRVFSSTSMTPDCETDITTLALAADGNAIEREVSLSGRRIQPLAEIWRGGTWRVAGAMRCEEPTRPAVAGVRSDGALDGPRRVEGLPALPPGVTWRFVPMQSGPWIAWAPVPLLDGLQSIRVVLVDDVTARAVSAALDVATVSSRLGESHVHFVREGARGWAVMFGTYRDPDLLRRTYVVRFTTDGEVLQTIDLPPTGIVAAGIDEPGPFHLSWAGNRYVIVYETEPGTVIDELVCDDPGR